MKILPAIDIKNHKCVRLLQGDYDKETVYHADPAAVAKFFKDKGIEEIHVVDLDGALDGKPENSEVIKKIADTGVDFEIGGGIRSPETVKSYLDLGAKRVILGSLAVEDIDLLGEFIKTYGDRIAVSVDSKDGYVYTHGWTKNSGTATFDFLKTLEDLGLSTLILTDIRRDGMLSEPNYELLDKANKDFSMDIIASGGVSGMEDFKKLEELGLYGAITGKAVYEGKIDLESLC